MPQVPYQSFSTVEPTSGGEKIQVSTPGAAFGENIGAAVRQLGSTTEQVGNELFQRGLALQELRNETDAREAQSKYAQQTALMQADFDAKEGKDSADSLQAHVKALGDLRTQIRGTLGTANAQRMFDADTMPYSQRLIFSSATRAGQQNKNYVVGTAESNMDLSARNYVNPGDEGEFNHKLDQVKSQVPTIAAVKGWGPEQEADYLFKRTSTLRAGQIEALSHSDPQAAMRLYEEHKTELTQQDADKTLNQTQQQNRTVGSRIITNTVLADLQDIDPTAKRPLKSLQEYMNEGDKLADKQAPDDPLFKDYVRARIEQGYRMSMTARRDFKQENLNVIDGAIVGSVNGKIPTSLEQLQALGPQVKTAYNNLDDAAKLQVLDKLARSARGDVGWTVDRLKTYQKAIGQAGDDPAGFLDQDVTQLDIPRTRQLELIKLQERIRKAPEGDPRVGRAMQTLGPTLQAAGVLDDKDQRWAFRGALQNAIEDFQTEHKKPPNTEEIKLMGTQLLQQTKTGNWFFNRNAPLFNLPVPDGLADKVREQAEKSGKPVPTDEQIRQEYVRQQYNRLYGGSAKKPEQPE